MATNTYVEWLNSQLLATESLLAVTKDSVIMQASLECRIDYLKHQIANAYDMPEVAKLDVWFSGGAVYGSQGISTVFMQNSMQSLVGMINSYTRETVRQLRGKKKKADMPNGQFYITALTHGSFGYELEYKDEQGLLFDDTAVIDSIKKMMDVIQRATIDGLDIESLIQEQPIQVLSYLKDLFTSLKKRNSIIKMESGPRSLSLDLPQVSVGFDNICLSEISEKEEIIEAVFQGALIESGKFECTDQNGKLTKGNISEDLSTEDIADILRLYSGKECKIRIVRRIVSYSNGKKRESVEMIGIESNT